MVVFMTVCIYRYIHATALYYELGVSVLTLGSHLIFCQVSDYAISNKYTLRSLINCECCGNDRRPA